MIKILCVFLVALSNFANAMEEMTSNELSNEYAKGIELNSILDEKIFPSHLINQIISKAEKRIETDGSISYVLKDIDYIQTYLLNNKVEIIGLKLNGTIVKINYK